MGCGIAAAAAPALLRVAALGWGSMDPLGVPPHWTRLEDRIVREVELPRYSMVLALVCFLGAVAAAMDHHPEVTFGYGHVSIVLTSHDVGAVTERDLAFAAVVEAALEAAIR
jgi:4a-hydroxytetrahydrobiopterin dehydratase